MANAYSVLVSDKLAPEGIALLQADPDIEVHVKTDLTPEQLVLEIPKHDGLIIRSKTQVTPELLKAASRLKAVARAGIGVDNVDLAEASMRGVLVMNAPEGNIITTAEHAIALMGSLVRKIPQATHSLKSGLWEKSKFQGRELSHKTLGIIGLGNIGRLVADRAKGLHMNVICYDPFITEARAGELGVEKVDLDALFSRSDVITLHVPLTESTRRIVNADRIKQMRKGSYLINAARGGLVDEEAVAEAISDGHLAGAAFDVFEKEPPGADHPLLRLDPVIATPHLGASTHEAQVNVAVAVAEQMIAYLKHGAIQNAVNAPKVAPALRKRLAPFIQLAEKLGRLAAQLHPEEIQKMSLCLEGQTDLPLAPVSAQALVGLLGGHSEGINPVSAPYVAKDRGIAVSESRDNQTGGFARAIRLKLSGPTARTEVLGALFSNDIGRVVKVNDYRLEIVPEGHVLLTEHEDLPGIIGRIGTLLATENINISRLTLSDGAHVGALARAAISVNPNATPELIRELEAIPGLRAVKPLDLR